MKKNEFRNVINHLHFFAGLIGILLLFLSFSLDYQFLSYPLEYQKSNLGIKVVSFLVGQLGGALLSIALVSFFYQKWRDRQNKEEEQTLLNDLTTKIEQSQKRIIDEVNKKNETYFFMRPSSLGSGEKLKEVANIDKKSGKILLIGEMKDGIKAEYGFTTLLDKEYLPLLMKNKPLFSYGTSFQFLDQQERPDYYKTIKSAIETGLGLNVSILYPDKAISDNENIDKIVVNAEDTIRNFNSLISYFAKGTDTSTNGNNSVGQIELRLSRYFSPCSFSSIEYLDGRTIRSLEFNFMHEGDDGVKMSQVYDNDSSKDTTHGQFSKYLLNRYQRLYKESILALKYPMVESITYYVLGIIADVPDKSKDQIKEAITDVNNDLIKIVVQMNEKGEYVTSSKANNTKGDNSEEGYNEVGIPVCLRNTIIGKVLLEYKNATGCLIKPNRSFEIDSNTYLLLGAVTKLPDSPNMINRENLSKNQDFIEIKLEEIKVKKDEMDKKNIEGVKNKGEIIRKVKRIINMS